MLALSLKFFVSCQGIYESFHIEVQMSGARRIGAKQQFEGLAMFAKEKITTETAASTHAHMLENRRSDLCPVEGG